MPDIHDSITAEPVSPRLAPAPAWALPRALLDAMIAHARACWPREACGVIAGTPRRAGRHYTARNVAAQPAEWFYMAPDDQDRIFDDIEGHRWRLLAIYHSHPRTPAYPSRNDLRLAAYRGVLHLIVSLADADQPVVRAYFLDDGAAREVELPAITDTTEG